MQENGRIAVTELADRVNLSKTPCADRMKRLEANGFIKGYRADLDPKELGFSYITFVQVSMDRTTTDVLDKFNAAVKRIPEVESCHMIAGGFDYLLKVRASDMAHYCRVLGDNLGALPGAANTHTYPVMETVSDNKGISPLMF